jgi:hypothetical protein
MTLKRREQAWTEEFLFLVDDELPKEDGQLVALVLNDPGGLVFYRHYDVPVEELLKLFTPTGRRYRVEDLAKMKKTPKAAMPLTDEEVIEIATRLGVSFAQDKQGHIYTPPPFEDDSPEVKALKNRRHYP